MNIQTFITASVILIVFILIIKSEIKKKKRGICSCGCKGCAMEDICHKDK